MSARIHLNLSNQSKFKQVWASLNKSEQVWTSLIMFKQVSSKCLSSLHKFHYKTFTIQTKIWKSDPKNNNNNKQTLCSAAFHSRAQKIRFGAKYRTAKLPVRNGKRDKFDQFFTLCNVWTWQTWGCKQRIKSRLEVRLKVFWHLVKIPVSCKP